jgi:hypothetical protein
MHRLAIAGAIALALLLALFIFVMGINLGEALAKNTGEWNDASPELRQWFKSVKSPRGIPCCDTADGHRTTWRGDKAGGYEVPILDRWVPVPPEAVVRDAGNPTGEAIIWYAIYGGGEIRIRCFVPGDGV